MPGNYNAVGGFAFNPHDPRPDPRPEPGDGRPVLANRRLELRCRHGGELLGRQRRLRHRRIDHQPVELEHAGRHPPTIGRISRYGVIPITADHDTAGPMTRTVADSAIMLGAMEGASPIPTTRPREPARRRRTATTRNSSTRRPERRAHRRAARVLHRSRDRCPARRRRAADQRRQAVMAEAIAVLKQQGAIVVDPPTSPASSRRTPTTAFRLGFLLGRRAREGRSELLDQLQHGMKRDYNAWLATLGPSAPVKTLKEHREWNLAHAKAAHQIPAVTLRHFR